MPLQKSETKAHTLLRVHGARGGDGRRITLSVVVYRPVVPIIIVITWWLVVGLKARQASSVNVDISCTASMRAKALHYLAIIPCAPACSSYVVST